MPTDTQILIGVLMLLAYILVAGVLTTLATRVRIHTQRHNLIVQARSRRKAYFDALADRHQGEIEV